MNSNIHQGLKRTWLGLTVSFVFLLVFTEALPWGHQMDMWVSHALFNDATGQFLYNHDTSWVEVVLHIWFKNLLLLIPAYALLQVLVGFWLKRQHGFNNIQQEVWRRWLAALLAALLSMLLVTYLKKWTNQACPWSLIDFAGKWPYTDLFAVKPWGNSDMACWPAGHASGGFILLSFAFVGGWPPNVWNARLASSQIQPPSFLSAHAFVWYAVVLGMLLGLARVAQGAHFFSHQFWSLWWVVLANMVFVQTGLIKSRWLAPLFSADK